MTTKISKEDLKSPDQMTQTLRRGFVWTTAHSTMVFAAFGAFVVIGIIVSVVSYLSEKKETTQQEKYFALEKSYTEAKRSFEEAARAEMIAAQTPKDKATPPTSTAKKATGDLQQDYGSVVTGFESFIAEDSSSTAAQMAALNLSDVYLSYKKNDEALAALQKVEKSVDKKDLLGALIYMQMGNVLANKNDCQGAIEKWQVVASSKALDFAHDEARLRMGLCYESMNDPSKAEAIYSEIAKKTDPSATDFAASKEAEKYLRVLKAKKNL